MRNLLALLVLLQPVVASAGDSLFEATAHLREASVALSACQPDEAIAWSRRAAKAIASAQPGTQAGRDTKTLLADRAEATAAEAKRLRDAVRRADRQARKHADAGRVESAAIAVAGVLHRYPGCRAAFSGTESAVRTRRAQAVAMAAQAKTLNNNPRAALPVYEQARELNGEDPTILAGLAGAKARQPRRSYKAAKVAFWLTFTAALGTIGTIQVDRRRRR